MVLQLQEPTFGKEYINALRKYYCGPMDQYVPLINDHWSKICARDESAPIRPVLRISDLAAASLLDKIAYAQTRDEHAIATATLELMLFEQDKLIVDEIFKPKKDDYLIGNWDLRNFARSCRNSNSIAILESLKDGHVVKYNKNDHIGLAKGGLLHVTKVANREIYIFAILVTVLIMFLLAQGINLFWPNLDIQNLNFVNEWIEIKVHPKFAIIFNSFVSIIILLKILMKSKSNAANDPFFTKIKSVYISKLGLLFIERFQHYAQKPYKKKQVKEKFNRIEF